MLSLIFLLLGVGIYIVSHIFFTFWVIVSENVGYNFRTHYLEAILNQETAWFDTSNPQELSSKLSAQCASIQKATGEKFAQIIVSFATTLGGFLVAFIMGWKFAFVSLGTFPFILVTSYLLTMVMQQGYFDNLAAYSKSGGYAEQALNAIRIVAAYGQESRELDNYCKHLDTARTAGLKTFAKSAASYALFTFVMFACYSYNFYFGGIFVRDNVQNDIRGRSY